MKKPIEEILKNWVSEYKSDFIEYFLHECEENIDFIDWLKNDFRDDGHLNCMAEQNTDVYNGALLDWFKQHIEVVSDFQDNIGEPQNMEIMNQIRLTQTYWHRERIAGATNELIEILEEEE